jgi:hypothetical protein
MIKKLLLSPWTALITLTLIIGVRVADPTFVESVRLRYFDTLIVNAAPTENGIYTVNIDEAAINKYGQWPFGRDVYASIIEDLYKRDAGLVVFNVLMPEADRQGGDAVLAKTMSKSLVILPNIPADQNYLFTIEESDITLPENTKITFGILGDIGQTNYSVSTINNLMKEQDISMILHAGDLSYADCEQDLWDSYGKMIDPLASTTPWMVCPGNHEIEFNGSDYTNLFTAFEYRYRMPYFKPAEFGDVIIKSAVNPKTGMPYCTPSIFQTEYNFGNSFFSFESGLAHIIYLNPYTNTLPRSQQFDWLHNDFNLINREKTPWVIIVMHCPWYSSNINHYSDQQTIQMRNSMEDLFYKYKVNIVFNGHVHDYERTYPVFRNNTDNRGTVYITIGNAGNLEGLDNKYYEQPEWSAFRNGTEYGYGIFTIIDKKTVLWKWNINTGKQIIPRDEVFLCNTIFGDSKCF